MKQSNKLLVISLIILIISTAAIAFEITENDQWNEGIFDKTSADIEDESGDLGLGYPSGRTDVETNLPGYENIAGQYRFDNEDGPVTDYSGNNFDGTNQGGTRGEQGILGTNAINFQAGENVEVDPQDELLSGPEGDITVSTWIRPDTLQTDFQAFAWNDPGQEDGWSLYTDSATEDAIAFAVSEGGDTDLLREEGVLEEDQWTHIVATYSESEQTIRIFADGNLLGETDTDTTSQIGDNDAPLQIGSETNSFDLPALATMDEFMVIHDFFDEEDARNLYFDGQIEDYEGSYTSETINEHNFHDWQSIEITSQIPDATEAELNFEALDEQNQVIDQQEIELDDFDEETIPIDVQNSHRARIEIEGTTSEIEENWIVEEINVEFEEIVREQIYWSAERYNVGEETDEWEEILGGEVSEIQEDEEGKYIEITGEETGRGGAQFTPIEEIENSQWYVKTEATDDIEDISSLARWQNLNTGDDYEAVRQDWFYTSDEERLTQFIDGSYEELITQSQTPSTDEVVMSRGEIDGDNLRGRWWVDEETDEWDLETTTDVTGQGSFGIHHWEGSIKIYEYSVGTEGLEAPTAPIENEIDLRTPEDEAEFEEDEEVEFEYLIRASESGEARLILDGQVESTHQLEAGEELIQETLNLDEADYNWQVEFEEDDSDEEIQSEQRTFTVGEGDPIDVEFELTAPENNEELGAGEPVEFEYIIDTDSSGTADIIANGETIDSALISSGETTVTTEENLEADEYEWYVEFEDSGVTEQSQTNNFELLEVFFQIEIIDTNSPADPDDSLIVETEVENTGSEEGTQDNELILEGEGIIGTSTVNLESGQTDTDEIVGDIDGIEEGVYTATAQSNNDEDSEEVQISPTFSGVEICGEEHELTPSDDGSRYNTIVIDGEITVCDEGATIEANENIEVLGEINGQGEDGEDPGEDGADLNMIAEEINVEDTIDMSGGDGADGAGFGGTGADGGDGGTIEITSSREPLQLADEGEIITEGGDGGEEGPFGAPGDGGDGGTIEINSVGIIEDGTLSVEEGAGPGSEGNPGTIIRNTPEIIIEETEYDEPVERQVDHIVEVEVTNTGDFQGFAEIQLNVDGTLRDTNQTEILQQGETTTKTLIYEEVDLEPGDYIQTVETERFDTIDDALTEQITVAEEFIEIRNIETNSPVTEQEDEEILEVEVIVENTGPVEGQQDVELYFDQENTDGDADDTKETRELNSGELQTLEFELDISEEPDDDYPVTIASESDEEITNIVKGEQAFFEIDITDTNSPLNEGETLEVDFEVENVGSQEDEQNIVLNFEGDDVDEFEDITLTEGETFTETFEYDTTEPGGEYTVEAETADDSETEEIFIGEEPFFDVEIENLEDQIEQGEDIEFEADITNTGDFSGTQDITFFFDDQFEDEEPDLTLEGGETETLDFSRETDSLSDGIYDVQINSDDVTVTESIQVGSYPLPDGDTEYEFMSDFELETTPTTDSLENPSGDDDGYADFTESEIGERAVLERGEEYEITLQSSTTGAGGGFFEPRGEDFDHYFSLFADWEQDVQFDTSYELDQCDADTGSGCEITATFEIPDDAELGETRIRALVAGFNTGEGDYLLNPSTSFEGEAEDYTVEVVEPELEVQEFEAPEFIGETETIMANTTIENTGGARDTQTIEYLFESAVEETEDLTLDPDESTEVEFEFNPDVSEEGLYSHTIRTEDDEFQRTIGIETANYQTEIIETNSPVRDDTLEVEVQVENQGSAQGDQTLEYYFNDEEGDQEPDETRENVEIDVGEQQQFTFTTNVEDVEDDDYPVRAETEDDFDITNVLIGNDPFFDPEITGTNTPIEFGETLEIDYEIENIGGDEDTQDINLLVEDEIRTTETDITLDEQESTQDTFQFDTSNLDDAGEVSVTIETEDAETQQEVIVGYEPAIGDTEFSYLELFEIENELSNPSGDDDGYADFTESEIGERAVVQRGETYTVTMSSDQTDEGEVVNYFTIFADWNRNFQINDQEQEIGECMGDEDGCQVTGTLEIPEDAELGETRLRAFQSLGDYIEDPRTDDYFGEAEDYTIQIIEEIDSEFEIIDEELPDQAEAGDTIEPEVTIENTGQETGTENIEYRFDQTRTDPDDEETIQLDPGQEQTIEFEYQISEDKNNGKIFTQEVDAQDDQTTQELEITEIDAILEVDIIEPEEDEITTAVDRPFTLEAEVTCTEDDCGQTEALTQFGDTEPDTEIPSNDGTPFHTENENERTCEGDLQQGETCTVSWEINTVEEDSTYQINVEADSENSEPAESENLEVTTEFILILETGFEEIDFGSGEPSGEEEPTRLEALQNLENVYTVSLDEQSNEPEEGLWMQSTPLENTETTSTNEDDDNAIIEPEHTLFGFNDESTQCETFEDTDTTRSSSSFQQILEDFEPGQTEEKCYFQEIPNGKLAGPYEGSLTLKVNATQ